MIAKRFTGLMVVVLLTCALSCLAEGIAEFRASRSCHEEPGSSSDGIAKSCCEQALVEPAFSLDFPLAGSVELAKNPQALVEFYDHYAIENRDPGGTDLYRLRSLRI